MKIVCLSSSNTKRIKDNSTSTNVCRKIQSLIKAKNDTIDVEIIPLTDYEFTSCILCGDCFREDKCRYDDSFNSVFSKLREADGIFFVVPYYTPIPSKLVMIFEKMNEIFYVNWFNNSDYIFPLKQKPTGIVAHGGMADNAENRLFYKNSILSTVSGILGGLSLDIVPSDSYENGTTFGLKDDDSIKRVDGNLLPVLEHDWDVIVERIEPLVTNVLSRALK